MSGYKDSVYQDVARGPIDRNSEFVLAFYALFILLAIVTVIRLWYSSVTMFYAQAQGTFRPSQSLSLRQLLFTGWRDVKQPPPEASRPWHGYVLIGFLTVLLGLVTYQLLWLLTTAVSAQYATRAASHYAQMRRLIAPYVDSRDLLMFDSRFAGMRSDSDYYSLLKDLDGVASSHQLPMIVFVPW